MHKSESLDSPLCFADTSLAYKFTAYQMVSGDTTVGVEGGMLALRSGLSSDCPVGVPCHHPCEEGQG